MTKYRLKLGDCLEVMKDIPDNSFHSVVTDPPAGISFMNKEWDKNKGGKKQWIEWMSDVAKECLRVLKPGGHALVWAIPRTSHWTATAWEDADFELRDCIYFLFGTGFPKSMDIGKQLDKMAGVEREVIGESPYNNRRPNEGVTGNSTYSQGGYKAYMTNPASDTAKQWDGWGTNLKPAVECWWLLRKPVSEKTVAQNVLEHGVGGININVSRIMIADQQRDVDACKHLSSLYSYACKWLLSPSLCQDALTCIVSVLRSYSTSDKAPLHSEVDQDGMSPCPAEYVYLVSRLYPNGVWCGLTKYEVQGSLADYQFYRHFCDEHIHLLLDVAQVSPALLADALSHICLGQYEPECNRYCQDTAHPSIEDDSLSTLCLTFLLDVFINYTAYSSHPQGRWPANLILDEEAAVLLDEQSGDRRGWSSQKHSFFSPYGGNSFLKSNTTREGFHEGYNDSGGASRFFKNIRLEQHEEINRFFYGSKASKKDRGEGNTHSTVKPTALMRYLCRLITPPNGIVFDPFMGSGSTGVAALAEGFRFYGIEKEAEYLEIAKSRIE